MVKALRITSSLAFVALLNSPAFSQENATADGSESAPPVLMEGLPEHLAYIYSLETSDQPGTGEQFYAGKRRWEPGDTLKVCFFGGNPVVTTLIRTIAGEWENYANIQFDFGGSDTWRDCTKKASGFSHIRIGFSERGYWSAIGTDSIKLLNAYQPSMNFENLSMTYSEHSVTFSGVEYKIDNVVKLANAYDKGTILHEFGHALALLHEHQNPKLACYEEIKWEGDGNVYDYMAKPPNGWSKDKVDRNIGLAKKYDPDAEGRKADPESIMRYPYPAQILKNGVKSHCYKPDQSNTLSKGDKEIVAFIYPKTVAPASVSMSLDSDAKVPMSMAVAIPNAAAPTVREDLTARIISDLESNETSVRREARGQLVALLENPESEGLARLLIENAPEKSYRHQLGLVFALSEAHLPYNIPKDYSQYIEKLAKGSADPTLHKYADRASTRLFQ
ncbi:hypothetical protein GAY28_24670 [Azospirillum brasilense]|nr:hypothetical protein [Azospirillum brasilense]